MCLVALGLATACGSTTPAAPAPADTTQDSVTAQDIAADAGAGADAPLDQVDAVDPDGAEVAVDAADAADGADSSADTADVGIDAADAAPDMVLVDAQDDVVDAVAPADIAPDAAVPDTAIPDTAIPDTADVGVDLASEDVAPIGKSIHSAVCATAADCNIPCATGACVDTTCKYTAKAKACVVDLGGAQVGCFGAGDQSDSATCLSCVPALSQTSLSAAGVFLTLDGPADSVQLVDSTKSGLGWNFNDKRSISGGKSLYFGDPVTHTYANGKHVAGAAATSAMTVPNAAGLKPQLEFWLWLDTEETLAFDLLTVSAIDADSATTLWTSDAIGGSTHGAWQRVSADLSALTDKSIQVVFTFDTKDAYVNGFEGVYLDDVALTSGCCGKVEDCDDGNPCSTDSCAAGQGGLPVCGHTLKAGCCNGNPDCDDKLPCTLDLCSGAGGECSHSAKPDCCMVGGDCDDQNECTVDLCTSAGGACQHQNLCCKTDIECKSADSCMVGSCAAGQCVYTSTCCNGDGDCDDFNPCTKDACDKGKCLFTGSNAPGCCTPNVLTAAFMDNDDGFASSAAVSGLDWHYKATTGAKSAPGVLHFGKATADTYSVFSANVKVSAASPAIALLAGKEATLTFQAWGSTSGGTITLRVYAVIDGVETTITTIYGWTIQNTWKQYTFDLTPLAGSSLQLFFEASLTGNTSGTGFYLDDVQVTSTCLAKKCTGSTTCATGPFTCLAGTCTDGQCTYSNGCCKATSECNDNNLCTTDTCTNKYCQFKPTPGCCMGNGDCNDGNACTVDTCPGPGDQCKFSPIAGCCLSSAQCDDKNTCTADVCTLNVCKNTNTCCSADKDCDDGEKTCTTDKCVNKACVHTLTGAAGCCVPELFLNDFDTGALKDIQISNSTASATQGWQLWSAASMTKTAPGALYYGNPATGNFDFGATKGSATLPIVSLPQNTPSHLEFWLYMDTEGSTFDDLSVQIGVDGGAPTQVWLKSSAGYSIGSWAQIKLDLSAHKGKDVKVIFNFDTKDSVGNGGKGVFIDDLKILTNCAG